jgi:hypothetical protein
MSNLKPMGNIDILNLGFLSERYSKFKIKPPTLPSVHKVVKEIIAPTIRI